jgi:hypothetical protein
LAAPVRCRALKSPGLYWVGAAPGKVQIRRDHFPANLLLKTGRTTFVVPRLNLTIPRSRAPEKPGGFTQETTPMPALVVHASKDSKSQRTLYINPALAVAKARGLSRRGWHVHVVDADGRMFYQEQFDELLQAGLKPAARP